MYQEVKMEKKLNINKFFEGKSIIVYVLSILLGMAKLSSGATPFGLAMIGAIGDYGFPLILPLLIIGTTTGIAFGWTCLLKFIIASLLFITMKSFLKGNSKTGTAAKLLFATAISEIIVLMMSNTIIYDGIMAAFMSVTTAIFYLVFSEGLPIIVEWGKKKITTYETLMATGVLIAVAATSLGNFSILGLSIRNIICVLIVLFLGWRKGMTCGIVAGLSVSLVLGMMGLANGSTVATYVVCGLLSGILSRFGKVGATIGFILGNAVWAFYSNASTEIIIPIGEIIVASLILFFLPKRVTRAVDNLFDFENILEGRDPVGYLAESTIFKLKSVSEVAEDMAENVEKSATMESDLMGMFMKNLKDNTCQRCSYYEKCWEKNYHSIYETAFNSFEVLKEKNDLEEQDISFSHCENKALLVNGLKNAFEVYKVNLDWGNKVKEDKKLVAKQLRGVSKAINTVKEELKEGSTMDNLLGAGYHMEYAIAQVPKQGNAISGDSTKYVQLKNGKLLAGISDGMGAGEKASDSSQKVLELLEKYLNAGLEKNVVMDLINSYMMLGDNQENYATLDSLVFDENTGKAQLVKFGACPTFVLKDGSVKMISSRSLPMGATINNHAEMWQEQWERGTIVVMISDGILEANAKKETWLKEVLESLTKDNIQRIADIILQEAVDENYGIAKDDMSVVVLKVC